MNQIKGLSLFTGAGGMDVGFETAGVEIVVANELVKYAADTYEANHPGCTLLRGDVNQYFEELGKYSGSIDIVFGGPPCQGFSVAGKMDPNDERSKLIWSYLKVVEIIQPKAFVMENVKALGELEKWSEVRKNYLSRVEEMGYHCHYFVLNASDYGVPQNRERVFFIGYKDEFQPDSFLAEMDKQKATPLTLRELFRTLPKAGTDGNPLTCTARITLAATPVMRKSPYAGMLFNGMGRPMNLDAVSCTLPASMGGNKTPIVDTQLLEDASADNWIKNYHDGIVDGTIVPEYRPAPERLRRLTINEAALIQTFPRDYIFKGTKSAIYTQIGNAVPCKLAECVARSVLNLFFQEGDRQDEQC